MAHRRDHLIATAEDDARLLLKSAMRDARLSTELMGEEDFNKLWKIAYLDIVWLYPPRTPAQRTFAGQSCNCIFIFVYVIFGIWILWNVWKFDRGLLLATI